MKYIPIGYQWTGDIFLKKRGVQSGPYPFDCMYSTPLFVYHMLDLLLTKNMDVVDLVRNYFFRCSGRLTQSVADHFTADDLGYALHDPVNHIVFQGDYPGEETIQKYIEQFTTLRAAILDSGDAVTLVYVSPPSQDAGNYTIDGVCYLVDVFQTLNQIRALVEKHNPQVSVVLFDAIKQEDPATLDPSIQYCALQGGSTWTDLIPQMSVVSPF